MYDIWVFIAALTLVQANFVEYYFARNDTCPGLGYSCAPPQVCAFDLLLNKYYCCTSDSQDICWTGATQCSGANQGASAAEIDCGSWCCLKETEQCTQQYEQYNICWSTQQDIFADVSSGQLRSLYQSLTSASPTAAHLTFDATSFVQSATSTSSSTSGAPSTQPPSSSTSAGAIAGIVIGIGVGVILISVLIYFLFRKKKKSKDGESPPEAWPRPLSGMGETEIMRHQLDSVTSQTSVVSPMQDTSSEMENPGLREYYSEIYTNNMVAAKVGESVEGRHEMYTRPAELSGVSAPLIENRNS